MQEIPYLCVVKPILFFPVTSSVGLATCKGQPIIKNTLCWNQYIVSLNLGYPDLYLQQQCLIYGCLAWRCFAPKPPATTWGLQCIKCPPPKEYVCKYWVASPTMNCQFREGNNFYKTVLIWYPQMGRSCTLLMPSQEVRSFFNLCKSNAKSNT